MTQLLPDLVRHSAIQTPSAAAIVHGSDSLSYRAFSNAMDTAARAFLHHGLERGDRVAVYLEKRPEAIIAMFAASAAGGVFVPINPVLRPHQVRHVLTDCSARVLVTSAARLSTLEYELAMCPALELIVVIDQGNHSAPNDINAIAWSHLLHEGARTVAPHQVLDADMTAILYTSGSTGLPKGVVLSHRNIVTGAASVCQYLDLTTQDRILSVLPISFDYGLNQFISAFRAGATAVIMNYLLPNDVIRAVAANGITGLGCVPSLWTQLAALEWPQEARACLRYITNTGGAMPGATLARLRDALPQTSIYLMYGLTEAFRSTYLPPPEVEKRPGSIGKAVPYAEIMVVNEEGRICGPGEAGELVHRGPLVSLGYWNDPERTALRFRPSPIQPDEISVPELAVWSGDTVRLDDDGYIYFIGRDDDMIKSSGYRISPTEIEDILHGAEGVEEAAAFSIPHDVLGQAIVVAVTERRGGTFDADALRDHCRRNLPAYMVPHSIHQRDSLPRNPNGKVDRRALAEEYRTMVQESTS